MGKTFTAINTANMRTYLRKATGVELVSANLLDSIKTAANSRDVPYQSLIKVWLQEKLHNR